ncbi:MAG: recombination mediator RecR [Wenzhouxiangellaceae bacterium]|nr:recombination mediator RecR [Wenzhouxiangellaceae bacterium]
MDPLIDELLEALRCLPGVGARSAQRMALHLLERDRAGAARLAAALERGVREIKRCESCRNLTSSDRCRLCSSERRSDRVLCVVETPADVMAIEQATGFDGRYFVLLGRLSPLDGIGPEALGLDRLEQRLAQAACEEVIVATNATVEGEATAQYILGLAGKYGVRATRLAQGVPLGGELEFTDQGTLAHAFASRRAITD